MHGRYLPNDVNMRGFHIPGGTMALWSFFILGNDPEIYPNPGDFKPERWLGEAKKDLHPFSNLYFGHGPRKCIGKRFAEIELQLLFMEILRNFRVEWAGNQKMKVKTALVNMPSGPLTFRFQEF